MFKITKYKIFYKNNKDFNKANNIFFKGCGSDERSNNLKRIRDVEISQQATHLISEKQTTGLAKCLVECSLDCNCFILVYLNSL